ncbi:hypothetical protein EMIT07CA2_190030 [Brevibacillus sp. IT-7CA2]
MQLLFTFRFIPYCLEALSMKYTDNIVIVTGGGQGIGLRACPYGNLPMN